MCGFAGLLTTRPHEHESLEHTATRMARTLVHRGPDDEGVWADAEAGIALGFRRLAIIDLSELGHQPMRSSNGRFWMVFNGEVYNFADLRTELEQQGWTFRGGSDTEVILAAFERWGVEAALPRFIGMFAMAVWDTQDRKLWLLRDRLGIKPLFVYAKDGVVAFASELKALLALPGFDRTVDLAAVTDYLRNLYVTAPRSIFQYVQKLLPGHVLEIRDAAAPLPAPRPYWTLADHARRGLDHPFAGDEQDALNELDRLVSDAVRLRLRADVPLGALLSAGIDSTTIVSLMQEQAAGRVRTFSIAFDAAEHNEAPHAARIAAHLGTDHTELLVSGHDALALVPTLPEMYDEPHADTAQIPEHLICRLARKDVIVALSGHGGDEVFGGYNRYAYGKSLISKLNRVPRPARRLIAAGIGSVSTDFWQRSHDRLKPFMPRAMQQRLIAEKLTKLQRMSAASSTTEMYRSLVSVWQNPEDVVIGGVEPLPFYEQAISAMPQLLDRVMLADQLGYLADDQLARADRASMATSLELRVPLLDHRLVEFSWRLPAHMKVNAGVGKILLRRLAYRRVPRELLDRPKTGFTVPLSQWLRGPLRDWAEGLLDPARLDRFGLLRSAPVTQAWQRCLSGHEPVLDIWAVLMLQAWAEHWL